MLLWQDGPEFMAEDAKMFKYPFPYLYDEVNLCMFIASLFFFSIVGWLYSCFDLFLSYLLKSQEVAKEFGAVCTPEFFLYKKVIFRSSFSSSYQ